jgi:membrane peptidoglycan carboxypeptidase
VADTLTSILTGVIDGPDPFRTGLGASIGRPAAGKTGTVNASRAAWFVGYTPQLAGAVWLGKPTPTPMKRVTINGRYYKQVYGGSIPASIWQAAMKPAHENLPVLAFNAADPDVTDGAQVPVPDVTGLPYDVAKQTLADAGFGVRSGGFVSAAPVRYGIVPYTSPRAGRMVTVGRSITVYQSNGRERYIPPRPVYVPPADPVPEQSAPPPESSPAPAPSKRKPGRG